MKKKYVLDTNVLLEDAKSIEVLRNGSENDIFLPHTVLRELDGLKKSDTKRHKVVAAIKELNAHTDWIKILEPVGPHKKSKSNDEQIIEEIKQSNVDSLILVSNDDMMRFRASMAGIEAEEYLKSNPFEVESQRYTGIVGADDEVKPVNSFFWSGDGKLNRVMKNGEPKIIGYNNEAWKVKPRNYHQNAAMELMLDEDIDIVSVQSAAGFGKSYTALACALYLTLEKKRHKKIYIVKPNVEAGPSLGFLPGTYEEKMAPFFMSIRQLLAKLHDLRPANKLFEDPSKPFAELNYSKIEMMPITYLRGMNLDDAFVIIDEIQNLDRASVRTVLSRMGQGTKVVCLGDVQQIDNHHLNIDNNGMNWIVKKLRGYDNYGHLVLSGDKSRSAIADIVRNSGL